MALRYENTDAPSEETSSVISRSLASFSYEELQELHASQQQDRLLRAPRGAGYHALGGGAGGGGHGGGGGGTQGGGAERRGGAGGDRGDRALRREAGDAEAAGGRGRRAHASRSHGALRHGISSASTRAQAQQITQRAVAPTRMSARGHGQDHSIGPRRFQSGGRGDHQGIGDHLGAHEDPDRLPYSHHQQQQLRRDGHLHLGASERSSLRGQSEARGAGEESEHLFVIPDTNVWHNFSNRDDDGVVQTVEEQELLSSIQDLQRKLLEVREEKEAWAEDLEKQGGAGNGGECVRAGPDGAGKGGKGGGAGADAGRRNNSVQDTTKRIVVVSNRLPVSMQKITKADGREVWTYEKTSGGLVSALRAAKEHIDFVWVGWVGQFIPENERAIVRQALVNDYGCVPVFLEKSVLNGYYHGFSNDILWPLFHYEPLPCFRPGVERKFDVSQWEAYRRANDIFANAINDILEDGKDMVWVHDYHLMLVPRLLRRLRPKVPIGWFLHVPFPSSDVYRMLPVRRKILEGVLAADLVGFHTYDYMRHFLSSAGRILGVESSPKGITTKSGHFCALGVFPIGIEPTFFQKVLQRPSCQRRVAELCKRLGHVHILIGIDRLDYIKGMPHKLLAYEHLLKTHPEYHGNIVLIQVGVPSRVQVKEYQKLASQVNELVGRINGTFGTLDYSPIHYIQRPVSTEELCALYNVANACIITSVRDGMNLVSHEYVAMQEAPCPASRDGPGMLVLSEFAGAAQSLSGAIRINPWNIGELAAAMHQALSTEKALRELQQKKLYRYVSLHTSSVWARSYLDELMASAGVRITSAAQRLERHNLRSQIKDLAGSKSSADPATLLRRVPSDDYAEGAGGIGKKQKSIHAGQKAGVAGVDGSGADGSTGGGAGGAGGIGSGSAAATAAAAASDSADAGLAGGRPDASEVGGALHRELVESARRTVSSEMRGSNRTGTPIQMSSSVNEEHQAKEALMSSLVAGMDRTHMMPQNLGGRRRRFRRLPVFRMLQAYKQAGVNGQDGDASLQYNRVLILDYDGLLATRDAVPELSRPSPFVTSYLVQLAANPSNLLVVLSGRSRRVLESWLTTEDGSPIKCAIGAENGVFFRANATARWEYMGLVQEPETWKSQVLPMIQFFSERTPGSRVEIKDGSLTWFYGDSDPSFASWQGKELRVHLDEVMTNFAIMVTQTSEYLEVRSQGCTKARIVSVLLNRLRMESKASSAASPRSSKTDLHASGLPGFVLCVGTEQSNPSIFNATSTAYSDALRVAASKSDAAASALATLAQPKSLTKTAENDEVARAPAVAGMLAVVAKAGQDKEPTNEGEHFRKKNGSHEATREPATERGADAATLLQQNMQPAVSAKEMTGNIGRLASIGVFTCFYGGQKKRESTDADFYVDSETDLRKILRGIVKLSDAGMDQ